jgi:SOS response regulatory protein OraA/RecX
MNNLILDIKWTPKKDSAIVTLETIPKTKILMNSKVVENHSLSVGGELTDEALSENAPFAYNEGLLKAMVFLKAARTEDEVQMYLTKKFIQKDVRTRLIEELKKQGYIDYSTFTELYIQSRLSEAKSRKAIISKLTQKGIDVETLGFEVSDEDEQRSIKSFVESLDNTLGGVPLTVKKNKIIQRGMAKGYEMTPLLNATTEVLLKYEDENYEEYYITAIDKRLDRYLERKRLDKDKIRSKLYQEFLGLGAERELIDSRISIKLTGDNHE